MNNYKAIIFDLGNVIVNISFDNVFEYWTKISNRNSDDFKNNFQFNGMFRKFERGEIKPTEYRNYISKKLGFKFSKAEFDNGWNTIYLNLVPDIENLLKLLKQDFRLVILTNTNEIHSKIWKIKYRRILNYFEKIFLSNEIKARKPERKVYEIVLDYLKLSPLNVIFLDDNIGYVEGALNLGIKSILVSSPYQMINELEKLGINVKKKLKTADSIM